MDRWLPNPRFGGKHLMYSRAQEYLDFNSPALRKKFPEILVKSLPCAEGLHSSLELKVHCGGTRIFSTLMKFTIKKSVRRSQELRRPPLRAVEGEDHESQATYEMRVCTSRTCRKSGSLQTLHVLLSLAPSNVTVDSCGCLGKCGAGPNLVVLPAELLVSHCNTAAHAARLLELQCGVRNPETNLRCLSLKEHGNEAFERGDLLEAEKLYTEAIQLNPSGGLHFIYANRSALRLALGNTCGALEDAKGASHCAPLWAGAQVQLAEVYCQLSDFQNAEVACTQALQLDPSLRRSKSFEAKLKQITGHLDLVHVSV